ncbi:hypothetical protein LWC33_28940 [Pseudonocardia sp. RS11V-5]|uniref:hypothetical protein n=1 Tax=Pseudonocardia terrae TaxID=2905831 RepID=UPI001E6420B2|nr:hypothetical protein [Pseudonocardia terrae]MCE3555460.1 hypothetical protein [Pseudonocardia terrae]
MKKEAFDRGTVGLAATLLLAGQLLYIVITQFHADGDANDHPAVFAEYAGSETWTAVHVGQFAATAILLAGLFVLFSVLDGRVWTTRWVSRLGAALAAVALALYGIVMAVDGVALKQAVNAWVNAPDAERMARFASAEAIRWVEWGARSYQDFALGLALLLLAGGVVRTGWLPRVIAYLTGLSGLTYLVQGWVAGTDGFTHAHDVTIVLAWALNLAWMIWLAVVAWRARDVDAVSAAPDGVTAGTHDPKDPGLG